ncbi:MAG: trypsin-like serine protease [Myxococcales bacterium]|nr:trypsin-like serine protease [Myxococcales bacterium]
MSFVGLAAAVVLTHPDVLVAPPPEPAPIFGGYVSVEGAWPTAVAIHAGSILCTGTLVRPDVVLTAAHCLSNVPGPSSISVSFGNNVYDPSTVEVPVIDFGFDPEFCPSDDCKEDIHDYGYLILAEPQSITPTRIVASQDEWDELMAVGETVIVVGYGLDENMTITGIKREVEVPITRFSKSGLEFQAGGMDKDSCQGDSGGPAFARLSTGEYVLAGITSRGYTCGKGGFYAVPYGGMCWLYSDSGTTVDLRPAGCELCDCVDTDPTRSEGCSCDAGRGSPLSGGGAWLVLLALLGLRQARKRSSSSSSSSSSNSA